jgi:branched-chain amino acid transport system substrate-binding protein
MCKIRRVYVILLALVFLILIGGQVVKAEDVIKIGVLSPLKTPPGEGLINAAKMAADEINNAGGIAKKKIELVIANEEYKPEVGVTAYKKLVLSDKVVIVLGTASSGVSMAVVDQMARYKVPFISTGAASLRLSDNVEKNYNTYKYWFRVMHNTDEIGGSVADWVVNYLYKVKKIKKVAIMSENALWTQGVIPVCKKQLNDAGMELVIEELFDLDTKDFKPILTKIINSGAEFIFDFSSHVDGAIYVKQWADMHGLIMGGLNASGTSSRFWKDTSEKAVSHVDLIQGSFRLALTPKTIPWFDKYVKEFGVSPDYTSGYTYDAIYIIKEAIERGKSTTPDDLVDALEKTDYVGAGARWVFQKNHNSRFGPGYRVMGMTQWYPDGERRVIWPENLKTGNFIYPPWYKK